MLSNRVNYIYWLSQIQYSERSLVGNKLFLLSQLLQRECQILPGFVLSNDLWQEFLVDLKEKLPVEDFFHNWTTLDLNDYQILQSVASRSRQSVIQASFAQSWQADIFRAAKQLNSEQIVLQLITSSYEHHQIDLLWRSHSCQATPEAIASTVKLVWSQLFSANSLLYWHRLGLNLDRVTPSILVRPLKTTYASGIIKLDRDLVQIKASWGLELSLWQGDAEPDEYYLDRHTGRVISQHIGQKSYAYRPTTSPTSSEQSIEAYVPQTKPPSTLVLDERAIAELLQLTEEILAQQPQLKYLTWTAFQESDAVTPNFYITNIEERSITSLPAVESQDETSLTVEPLLTGVAVSPGKIQATVIAIEDLDTSAHSIPPGSILVTRAIDPQHLSLLRQVSGIITETGGATSHGAILARELKIPAIVNIHNATKLISNGTEILLDGTTGKVYPPLSHRLKIYSQPLTNIYPTDPIATKLMVNLSQPESIASAIDLPIDGVGLLRSELMLAEFLASQTMAQWQETFKRQFVVTLTNSLRQFTTAFAPRPVFYRSLDRYTNSALDRGSRGTYSYLDDPTLFDLELEVLQNLAVEGQTNLNLILPFVRSVDEFEFCHRRLENIGLTARNSFQVWIMTEVPSAILLLPEYIRAGVKGIAIGTNDLTQLLLGVDRQQTQFSDRGLNANHPAMQRAIYQLIEIAHNCGIQCSICGRAPVEHPSLIEQLIRWGIDAISVEPEAVNRTYHAIARAERRLLLERVREDR